MKDGKYYDHRPTFYCRENDYCMFYLNSHKQWCIFWRVSPKYASCRLQTSRGPHMGGDAVWSCWDQKKKGFVKCPDMVCRLLTVEELIALAPESVLMTYEQLGHCWFEAPGAVGSKRRDASGHDELFKKNGDMHNDRPVYQSYDGNKKEKWQWGNRFLFYSAEQKIWKLGMGSVNDEKVWYLHTQPTDCYSPLVAPWVDSKSTRYRPIIPDELDAEGGFPPAKGGKKTKYRKVVPWCHSDFLS